MLANGDLTMRLLQSELPTIDLTPRLGSIRCPTLILSGEDDPACPIEGATEMTSLLPAHLVRLERISNAGHSVLNDQPERALRILRDFIVSRTDELRTAKIPPDPRGALMMERAR